MNNLGNKIKALRDKNSWSLSDLSNKCNIPVSTLHGIEKGSNPSFDKISKIAEAFGMTSDELTSDDPYDKKVNRDYYKKMSDDEIIQLLEPLGLNKKYFKDMSDEDKANFINNHLVEIEPLKLKLQSYLNNFKNFKKQDLVDLYNELKQYDFAVLEKFIDEEYNILMDKTINLLKRMELKNEFIDKLQQLNENNKKIINNQNKIINNQDEIISSLQKSIRNYETSLEEDNKK